MNWFPFVHFLSTIDAEVGFDVYVYSSLLYILIKFRMICIKMGHTVSADVAFLFVIYRERASLTLQKIINFVSLCPLNFLLL